ncbi:hypothetical protein Msi02_26000 [Microbispora siamensis]|uniref:Tyr recombinase domain-containing protein n=1 Tax=Microbispora siamensis TaxID=564413 RepID=A0ABQ4GK38_9ACTN|nr:hypothetical protein Msi02_26000 [Microbispora siamensis]
MVLGHRKQRGAGQLSVQLPREGGAPLKERGQEDPQREATSAPIRPSGRETDSPHPCPGPVLRVKAAAEAADLDNPGSYSAHSLRAGGTSAAAAAGRSMLAIARHGRWVETSPLVHGYVRAADMWRDNPMRGLGV